MMVTGPSRCRSSGTSVSRDFAARTNLAARYGAIGRYQQALEEAREGLRLNPDAGVAYAALARISICLGRHREAGGSD